MKPLFALLLALFLGLLALPTWAAMVSEGTAVQSQSPGTGTTVALQCGTNPNRFVHVAVAVRDATAQMSGITYNTVSLTESITKAVISDVTGQDFYLNGAASGSNTLSMTVSASKSWAIVAECWSGVDPNSPVGTAVSTTAAALNISVNATGFANGLVLDALAKDDASNTCSPQAGQTESVVGGRNGTNTRSQSSHKSGSGTVTMGWDTCTNFINGALIALPVKAASPSSSLLLLGVGQ